MGRRNSYLGGSTIIRRAPNFSAAVWRERGPNANEGEQAIQRAEKRQRDKIIKKIDKMNRPR